eukprot:12173174-Karenia_brevis.AAC.1
MDPVDGHLQLPLVWMPAHGSRSSVGHAIKSDGSMVSSTDWRANRLADALAKAAAGQHVVSKRISRYMSDALEAYEYGAALAGVTCKAANCYHCTVHLPDGSTTEIRKRDSEPGQRPLARPAQKVSISRQSMTHGSTPVVNTVAARPKLATRKRKLELAHQDRLEASF